VDLFGTLVSSRILVPANELDVRDDWLKLSNQRKYIDDGNEPLPIYTAVRHEIPSKDIAKEGKNKNKTSDEGVRDLGSSKDYGVITKDKDQLSPQPARKESWFQWFELTPYDHKTTKLIKILYRV
jgi:phospholipase A2